MSPLTGSDWCLLHTPDPALREKLRAGRVKGGQRTRKAPFASSARLKARELPKSMTTISDIFKALEVTARAVLLGRLEPKQANAAAFCFGVMNKFMADRELEAKIEEVKKLYAAE